MIAKLREGSMLPANDYYQESAQDYFQQTFKVDVEPLHSRFLAHIPKRGKILDAGCGSGRDARAFLESGYQVKAFDASPDLVRLATEYIGQPVEVLRFQELMYRNEFDGIWACASLLHVPLNDLPDVFKRLFRALNPGGVLYASFKYGTGELEHKGRRFTNMSETVFALLLEQVERFSELDTWVSEDRRPDRINVQWFNTILKAEG